MSMNVASITNLASPLEILEQAKQLFPADQAYFEQLLIQRFGSPEQMIYVDRGQIELNGIKYESPLILPLYNGQLDLIECAVLQQGQQVQVIPNGQAKGFAYYGNLQKNEPVIITYDVEAYFRIAQTDYAVVLVVLPNLCKVQPTELKVFDFEQIQLVIHQLSEAGYQQLYMPVRSEHIKLESFQKLEQNNRLRLLNQYQKIGEEEFCTNLSTGDEVQYVQDFIREAIALLPKKDPLPKGHLAKPFKMDDGGFLHVLNDGLYLIKEKQNDAGEVQQTRTFISHSVMILGEARSKSSENWKRVIQFRDRDNIQHTLVIPYEYLTAEVPEALRMIAYHGLMPPRQQHHKNVFMNYIQNYPAEKRFRCVAQTGWHGQSFVTTNRTYGNHSDEELLFHSEMKDPYSMLGSFEGWQQLSQLIEPHALAVLAFSCAFAGQLVLPLGAESGGFHIYGSSTDGKSTITKAACSVWGNPKNISLSWRATDNAVENEAELRNDSFMNLDELRQAAPKAVSDIVYMLTGGQGKARSNKSGKNREVKQFSLMYTSTGEVTLEEHLRRGNLELDAGLLLRFAHLSSDAGKGYGVFEQINYGTTSSDLGNRINELLSQHYGHAGIKWLEYLTHDKDRIMVKAQTLLDEFTTQHTQAKNGQANRVLRRFALVAVAGELATQAGITGWQQGRAFEALGQCFHTWLRTLGNGENIEETLILEHIKSFFTQHGLSRFENLTVMRHHDGEVIRPRIHNRVGYYDKESNRYLVYPELFKSEICKGLNHRAVVKALMAHKWLDCDQQGKSSKLVRLPDSPKAVRVYQFNPTMFSFDSENEFF